MSLIATPFHKSVPLKDLNSLYKYWKLLISCEPFLPLDIIHLIFDAMFGYSITSHMTNIYKMYPDELFQTFSNKGEIIIALNHIYDSSKQRVSIGFLTKSLDILNVLQNSLKTSHEMIYTTVTKIVDYTKSFDYLMQEKFRIHRCFDNLNELEFAIKIMNASYQFKNIKKCVKFYVKPDLDKNILVYNTGTPYNVNLIVWVSNL